MKRIILIYALLAGVFAGAAEPDLSKIADAGTWRLANRKARFVEEGDRKFVRFDPGADKGMVWLVGSDFNEGTIDVDLRGKNDPGKSFIGIAFRGVDDATYDVVYFRPFNFKNDDVTRRPHAVQYMSLPAFPWLKLRTEMPGKYEQAVSPVPDPDGWFHARIVIEGRKISVWVNDATAPSLVVNELTERKGGQVGLWTDNGAPGDFANLRVNPKKN